MAEKLLLLQWCKNYSTGILLKAWLEVFLHITEFYPTLNLPGPWLFFWLKGSKNYVHSTMKFSLCLRNHSTKSLKYKMLPSSHLYKIQLCISFKIWDRFFFLFVCFGFVWGGGCCCCFWGFFFGLVFISTGTKNFKSLHTITYKVSLPALLPLHSILAPKIICSFYFPCSTEDYNGIKHVSSYLRENLDLLDKGSCAALFSMLFFTALSHQG